jgi:hypothetical protein
MKKLLVFVFLSTLLTNCKNQDDASFDCTNTACTEIFVTLIISVQDISGNAIALDSFEVLDKETNKIITISLSDSDMNLSQLTGEYPLVNDLFVKGNENAKKAIIFSGFINGVKEAEEEYEIDVDCCHVSLASGDEIIIVE